MTAQNRSASLERDYSFTIYNLPGAGTVTGLGTPPPPAPFRVRVVCSDGTVGETGLAYPEFGSTVVYTGDIYWRRATPTPLGVSLSADQALLRAGQTTQLRTSGAQVDLTGRVKGTFYTSSNPQLAAVSEAGLVSVDSQLASNFSARVVMTAQNEGVAGSTLLRVGGRGNITGRIYRADGVTPVAGARVNIMGEVPRQVQGGRDVRWRRQLPARRCRNRQLRHLGERPGDGRRRQRRRGARGGRPDGHHRPAPERPGNGQRDRTGRQRRDLRQPQVEISGAA